MDMWQFVDPTFKHCPVPRDSQRRNIESAASHCAPDDDENVSRPEGYGGKEWIPPIGDVSNGWNFLSHYYSINDTWKGQWRDPFFCGPPWYFQGTTVPYPHIPPNRKGGKIIGSKVEGYSRGYVIIPRRVEGGMKKHGIVMGGFF